MNLTSALPSTSLTCDHCGNEFRLVKIRSIIEGEDNFFCCEGCETVYSLIRSLGGGQYYSLKGTQRLEPVSFDVDNRLNIDSDAVAKKFVRSLGASSEVLIQINNIHCSACVWLNEKVLADTAGIISAHINFASGRARVEFNPNQIKLSSVLETIRHIGYKPQLYTPGLNLVGYKKNLTSLFLRIGVAGFSFANIMILSVSLYGGYFTGMDFEMKRLFHFASWFFATPAYLYSGFPFMKGFLISLKRKTLTMDFLLFFGISLAYFYSVYVTLTDKGEVYFDSVAMIYFFILIGKFFEEKARLHASDKLEAILCRLPDQSLRVVDGLEEMVLSEELKLGDRIKVLPGGRVPVDGIIESDSLQVDESFLTGESKPIFKRKGDRILAGSLALDSHVTVIAMTDYNASTLSSLKLRMEEALLTKPKIQILTEKIAAYFISIVFVIAMLTLIGWLKYTHGDLERSLIYTISVLIVACPCALGISVPTALVMNHILNAEKGVLLKNPSVIEPLSKIDHIFLDKTGTLTEGKFLVRNCSIPKHFFPIIYVLEKQVNHPLAKSIVKYLSLDELIFSQSKNISILNFSVIPGKGVKANVSWENKNLFVLIGNKALLESEGIETQGNDENGSMVYFSINNDYQGQFILADEIRRETVDFVQKLKSVIPKITILSGDREIPVKKIAEKLGLHSYHYDLGPEEKKAFITSEQKSGKVVAMVGDGINDSISLAGADVSISHTEAEDLSLEKADVVLTSGNLNGILFSITSARQTRNVIFQNIIISLCYNSVMLPLAVFGLMLPVICAVFMALSSLTVLLNSLSLRIRIK